MGVCARGGRREKERERGDRQGSSIQETEKEREEQRVLRCTVVGRILICGVGFGDGVLEPSNPGHPLFRSCFSVSPGHPAGSRTGSGEDASCVVVQFAASREIVVGLNLRGRGSRRGRDVEWIGDGGG